MSRKRHKNPRWWPGMYEGKTPQETYSEIGTAVPKTNFQGQNSDNLTMFTRKGHHGKGCMK